jgi:16S rRNA (guanine527-N7)-methyltransferase
MSTSPVSRETLSDDERDIKVRDALLTRYPAASDGLIRYCELLADAGVVRGLLGPREVGRLWERHLANSAVVAELIPEGSNVVDVGSGAGLPGIPLALVRPDLHVILIEPLLRRATFLTEAVTELGLGDQVTVRRSRAEDFSEPIAQVVTARAVAPLDRLAGWALPLVPVGGCLLAMKGITAEDEARQATPALLRLGAGPAEVVHCGSELLDPPTIVIRVPKVRVGPGRRRRSR